MTTLWQSPCCEGDGNVMHNKRKSECYMCVQVATPWKHVEKSITNLVHPWTPPTPNGCQQMAMAQEWGTST